MRSGARYYKQVEVGSEVHDASPHRLIQMLLEGALEKINLAKGYMERKQTTEKCKVISDALNIVMALRASLNHKVGADIAKKLDDLYDFVEQHLLEANMQNNLQLLNEAHAILLEIKTGWNSIPEDVKKEFKPPANGE